MVIFSIIASVRENPIRRARLRTDLRQSPAPRLAPTFPARQAPDYSNTAAYVKRHCTQKRSFKNG